MAIRFLVLTVLLYSFLFPNTISYKIIDQDNLKLQNGNILMSRKTLRIASSASQCIPVLASREMYRSELQEGHLHGNITQKLWQQIHLCHACGSSHNISDADCKGLALKRLMGYYSRFSLSDTDIDKNMIEVWKNFQAVVYRSSNLPFECFDQCVWRYLNLD